MARELGRHTSWSEERVRELVRQGGFSYQDIPLPYGLSTGGTDRSPTARAIFPADLSGKSVLDLGCKYGYFCFEALRRGAERVVGVDVDPQSVSKARQLADCLAAEAEFELLDIESEPIRERFDYVLCLNLLHHMRNPLFVLERLMDATRERLVLEVANLNRHDRRKLRISPIDTFVMKRRPILYASRNGTSDKRNVQKFFITPSAIENLLRYQRNIFARVDTLASEQKSRFIAIAHRRRIRELVVVAGPTASGTGELVEKLVKNEAPELASHLGIGDGTLWTRARAEELVSLTEPAVERLILEYDFLRPHLRSVKTHARDEALDVLETAERVALVTLWRTPEQLRRRFAGLKLPIATRAGLFFEGRQHRKLRREYQDPARLEAHYREWLTFAHSRSASHVVFAPEEAETLRDPQTLQRALMAAGEPD